MAKWDVTKEGYDTGSNFMQASCHHHIGRNDLSACGGCYARLMDALRQIEETGDASIAKTVRDHTRAEGWILKTKRDAKATTPGEKEGQS